MKELESLTKRKEKYISSHNLENRENSDPNESTEFKIKAPRPDEYPL